MVVDKGQDPGTEGYSGFEATELEALLRARGVDRVTIAGLATDYCVKNTALDALRLGFGVTVDSAAVRGVDVEPGDSERALDEVRAAGGDRQLSSTVSSNMTSPSSVRCTGHLAAICVSRSRWSSGSSLGRCMFILNLVGEPRWAGS